MSKLFRRAMVSNNILIKLSAIKGFWFNFAILLLIAFVIISICKPKQSLNYETQTLVKSIGLCNGDVICKFGATYRNAPSERNKLLLQYYSLVFVEKKSENVSFVIRRFQFSPHDIDWTYDQALSNVLTKKSEYEISILKSNGATSFRLLKQKNKNVSWDVLNN